MLGKKNRLHRLKKQIIRIEILFLLVVVFISQLVPVFAEELDRLNLEEIILRVKSIELNLEKDPFKIVLPPPPPKEEPKKPPTPPKKQEPIEPKMELSLKGTVFIEQRGFALIKSLKERFIVKETDTIGSFNIEKIEPYKVILRNIENPTQETILEMGGKKDEK